MKTRYDQIPTYITRDGSHIRELMHPASHACNKQSLAEAIIKPGEVTALHCHRQSEELYHITKGNGLMTLGEQQFDVSAGDTICIPAETAHCIKNTGESDLHILCCCSPAYSHEDTILL